MDYDLIQKPPRGRKEEEEYYVVPVYRGTVDEEHMAQAIVASSSLTQGDVLASIAALKDQVVSALAQGYKVRIKGVGTFRLQLTTPHKTLQSTDKVAKQIVVRDVAFRPERKLVKQFANVSFTRTDRSRTLRRVVDTDTLLASLRTYFATNDHLRSVNVQTLAQCSRAKACKLLREFVAQGYLVNKGDHRSPLYVATEKLTAK